MPKIDVLLNENIHTINPNIYGHFAEHLGHCIEGGIWVGEDSAIPNTNGIRNDVANALKRLNPPILRWPGGCFADDYHWRDGIGPRQSRPKTVNIHWGEAIETNEFGTHEFIDLCRAIGAAPYFAGNVGTGTPQELRDWIEYCNFGEGTTLSNLRKANGSASPFDVKYWGIGNENWGCGGLYHPEQYADEYRRYTTYTRNFDDTELYLVACGPAGNDHDWTERFFERLLSHERFKNRHFPARVQGFSAHYYIRNEGTATEYTDAQWYNLLKKAYDIETLIIEQRAIMDRYDPQRNVGLIIDEWGTWHPPTAGRHPRYLWQQNTLRDALVAAITFDVMNNHADKVVMANIAQTINVLQAMILTEDEKMLLTPTYHVFDLYQTHQGGTAVRTVIEASDIDYTVEDATLRLGGLLGSASRKDNVLTLTVVNPHIDNVAETDINLSDGAFADVQATTLTHASIHAHNTFGQPDEVTLSPAAKVAASGSRLAYTFPAKSITRLDIRLV